MANKNTPIPITERFWMKVDKNGPIPVHCPELGNCWVWTGTRNPDSGHGQFHMSSLGRDIRASRAAWILFVEEVTSSDYICHHCDNPACVRLTHLYKGTHQTNMQDRTNRTQWQKYRRNTTKLDWKLVREIRLLIRSLPKVRGGRRYESVAERFGLNVCTVSRIARNWNWKEEEDPQGPIQ